MLRSLSIAALVASAVFAYPPNFPHDQPDQSNDETPYKKYVSDLALFREVSIKSHRYFVLRELVVVQRTTPGALK